jgi:hypothetical protein
MPRHSRDSNSRPSTHKTNTLTTILLQRQELDQLQPIRHTTQKSIEQVGLGMLYDGIHNYISSGRILGKDYCVNPM